MMSWAIFGTMIALLLMGFPMMIPLLAGALIGFLALFGGFGQLDTMVQQILAGIRLTPIQAVAIGFLLNTSSYYGEIYRAGIESVGRGQWEAARSTGLTWTQTLGYVVLPQAVRNVLPDLVSNTIEVVKLTSIASVVSFPELLYSAEMARSLTFNSSPVVLAAALYLAILWPLVRLVSRLERRIAA